MTDHDDHDETAEDLVVNGDKIREMLDQVRPDRYETSDRGWQSSVVDFVADNMSASDAKTIAAVKIVGTAESVATRRTNKMLREIAEGGEKPLGWLDAMRWPLATDDNRRVALGAATSADLELFANRERRAAANEFASRNLACEGALKLAEDLKKSRKGTVGKMTKAPQ